jgi:uncharacterized protein DUF4440
MLRAYTFPLSLALFCLIPNLGAAQVPADLKEAMRLRGEAVAKADATTWDRLTADDFTVVLADGKLRTKAERLAEFKTQKPMRRNPPRQEQIKQYGDTFVRRFLGDNGWVLEVWTKEGAKWRVSLVQVTAAAKP